MLAFEKACDEISAAPSRKEKIAILESYKENDEVRNLFVLCFSSTVNFGVILSETEIPYSELDYNGVGTILFNLLAGDFVSAHHVRRLGKWITRLINRNLKIGIAEAAVERVWPGSLGHTKIMEPDEIIFGPGEDFRQLIHHLEDSKNWSIYGSNQGIPCLCHVAGGRVLFAATSPINLINTHLIEEDIRSIFKSSIFTLQGKLVLMKNVPIQKVYEVFTNTVVDEEDFQSTFFQVQDVIESGAWKERMSHLQGIFGAPHDQMQHVGIPSMKQIDYHTTIQLEELREIKYSKAYLAYDKGEYKTGKTRDFLSLKL